MSKTALSDLNTQMSANIPKPTAFQVAALRAAHQFLDQPVIFSDPVAFKILGEQVEKTMRQQEEKYREPFSNALRTALVVRSRAAEDEWAAARLRGVRQYVILGAGLDTYAHRDTVRDDSTIFEVDLPATQAWKRSAVEKSGIPEPDSLRYVAVDFETEDLLKKLKEAGFKTDQPAFFSWLGVVVYLDPNAVRKTLQQIGTLASGSAIVFDYAIPAEMHAPMTRIALSLVKKRVADQGEPWKSSFHPEALTQLLRAAGFHECHDLTPEILTQRYLNGRTDKLRLSGVSHIMHAKIGT